MFVDFYEFVGYLLVVIFNYLLLFGWFLDDKMEYFIIDEMIKEFNFVWIIKVLVSFDLNKFIVF